MLLRSLGILFCTLLLAAPAGAATCGSDFDQLRSRRGISQSIYDGSIEFVDDVFRCALRGEQTKPSS